MFLFSSPSYLFMYGIWQHYDSANKVEILFKHYNKQVIQVQYGFLNEMKIHFEKYNKASYFCKIWGQQYKFLNEVDIFVITLAYFSQT